MESSEKDIKVVSESAKQNKLETMYYVAGWNIYAMNMFSQRRTTDISQVMKYTFDCCLVDQETARIAGL